LERYSFDDGLPREREDQPEEYRTKIERADSAIKGTMMWGYAAMLSYFAQVLIGVVHWSEQCPCHELFYRLEAPTRHTVRKRLYQRSRQRNCGLETRRAPECAAGDLDEKLDSLLELANNVLVVDPCFVRCAEQEKTTIMDDFVALRRHIVCQLPYVLFGLAHHDVQKARRCIQRALGLAQRIAHFDPATVHYISKCLLAPNSLGRKLLERFADAEIEIHGTPYLEIWCAVFLFTTISERWIESRHALIMFSLLTARHKSAVHIALGSCLKALRTLLSSDPERLPQLAEICSRTRNPVNCLRELGLWQKPEVQDMLNSEGGSLSNLHHKRRKDIVKIIYHCDIDTMFGAPPATDDQHDPPLPPGPQGFLPTHVLTSTESDLGDEMDGAQGAANIEFAQDVGADLDPPAGSVSHDRLWAIHMIDLVRDLTHEVTGEGSIINAIFSLNISSDDAVDLQSVASVVNPAPPSSASFQIDDSSEGFEEHKDNVGGMMFFSPQELNPSRLVVPDLAHKIGDYYCIVVALLRVASVDMERKKCQVHTEGIDGSATS